MDYPRVTEVLKTYSGFNYVPEKVLAKAAERGTIVHSICAGIAKGAFIPDDIVEEDYKGYVRSFKLWASRQVQSFDIVEERYFDTGFGYSGQIDFVITGSDGLLYLVDIKTSARPQKTYALQLAAYAQLLALQQIDLNGAMLVYLDKNGEFPEIEAYEDLKLEQEIFHCALRCWYFFNKGRKKDVRKNSDTDTE